MINQQGKGKKENEVKFGESTQKDAKHIGHAFNNKKQIASIDEAKKREIEEKQKILIEENKTICLEWSEIFDGRQFYLDILVNDGNGFTKKNYPLP